MTSLSKKLLLILIPVIILLIGCMGLLLFLPDGSSNVYVEQIKIARQLAENGDYQNAIVYYKNAIANDDTQNNFEYISNDMEVLKYFQGITGDFIGRNKQKKDFEEQGMSDDEIFEKMQCFEPIFIFIADLVEFINTIYHPEGEIGNLSGFFENIFEKGYLHNIFFFGCLNTDEASSLAGIKSFHLFTSYKKGVHLGGNVSAQRIFNFQNIHYSQLSKSSKKGEGLVPSEEDESLAKRIILPLAGGRNV